MTEERFAGEFDNQYSGVYDNGKQLSNFEVVRLLNELAEENKELQARNNRQAKRLNDLYQLIEQEDWGALTDILDDFKKAEEQLQKEWKCYE